MSDDKKQQHKSNQASFRAHAFETLAAQIYAPLAATAAQRGKTYEAVALDALAAARAFYAALDRPQD